MPKIQRKFDLTHGIDFYKVVEAFENGLIREAMRRCNHRRSRAAALLGLNRTTLIEKLKKMSLNSDNPLTDYGTIIFRHLDEDDKKMEKKADLYARLFIHRVLRLYDKDKAPAKELEAEKFISIRDHTAFLDEYCTEENYIEQTLNNQRRWKTIVTAYGIDAEDHKYIKHKHYFPYHQSIKEIKKQFFYKFPSFEENELDTLAIQYTDSLHKMVWTVYETEGI